MAKRIKETPILYGTEATRFLREIARNAKHDCASEYLRAKKVFDQVNNKRRTPSHAFVAR